MSPTLTLAGSEQKATLRCPEQLAEPQFTKWACRQVLPQAPDLPKREPMLHSCFPLPFLVLKPRSRGWLVGAAIVSYMVMNWLPLKLQIPLRIHEAGKWGQHSWLTSAPGLAWTHHHNCGLSVRQLPVPRGGGIIAFPGQAAWTDSVTITEAIWKARESRGWII